MPRYEYTDDKSKKFWEIEREGDSFTTRFGRIGTDGQTSTKTFDDEAKCIREYDKLVQQKTKKGYALVAAQAAGPSEDRNRELEAAIFADPDDRDAWRSYGEWLTAQGDVRGEIIALELAGHSPENEQKKNALVAANLQSWLGDRFRRALADGNGDAETVRLEWRYGFLDKVRVATEYDYEGPKPVELLRDLFKSSASRFLRELRVGLTDAEGENSYEEEILAISKAGKLEALEYLFLGDFEFPDETEISWTDVGDIAKMFPVLPALKRLEVQGGGITSSKPIDLPRLETLIFRSGGLSSSAVQAVASARLDRLVKLELWLGAEDYGAEADLETIRPILDGDGLPALKDLGLRNAEFENEIAAAMPGAKILGRLERLDLSMGTMTSVGARAIAEHAATFQHLERLDVSDNFIDEVSVAALVEALGPIVQIGDQQAADEWNGELHYYVSVGE